MASKSPLLCLTYLMIGVLHRQTEERSKDVSERYIHMVSNGAFPVIITGLRSLFQLFHQVDATLHDNTYKRLNGDFKEWEVVAWIKHLNMRMSNCVFSDLCIVLMVRILGQGRPLRVFIARSRRERLSKRCGKVSSRLSLT